MEETGKRLARLGIAAFVVPVCAALALALTQHAWAAAGAKPDAKAGWRPAGCPPPAERGRGPSTIKVTGPCAFEHHGEAECNAEGDDLLLTVIRKARNSAEVLLYVNVERYVGPGTYKAPNDVLVSVKEGSKLYRWWTNATEITVGPESRYVTLKDVALEPELVLIGCTGPQTNFQCDGRGDESENMHTVAHVTGTLYCKADRAKKQK